MKLVLILFKHLYHVPIAPVLRIKKVGVASFTHPNIASLFRSHQTPHLSIEPAHSIFFFLHIVLMS